MAAIEVGVRAKGLSQLNRSLPNGKQVARSIADNSPSVALR